MSPSSSLPLEFARLLIAGERFVTPISIPKPPGRYYFLFGEPISSSQVDPADKEACAALYSRVRSELETCIAYLLEKRKEDRYEPLLPRAAIEASWGFERQACRISHNLVGA